MYKKSIYKEKFIDNLEFLLLILIVMSIASQIILGDKNILFRMLRLVYVPGMIFFAGYYTSRNSDDHRMILKKAGFYFALFVILGTLKRTLLYHDNIFQIFIKIITFTKIPEQTEIFFTMLVVLFCSAFMARYMNSISQHKVLLFIFSVAALGIIFVPSDIFGYPIIGVFFNCDTYNCTPILPYIGFYFSGIMMEKSASSYRRNFLIISVLLTLLSLPLALTALRPVALITVAAFPLYVLYIFSNCSFYQKIYQDIFSAIDRFYSFLCGHMLKLQRKLPCYFLGYTVFFFIMALLVFYPFIDNNKSIVWMHDAIAQYVPKVHYFINYVHNAISQILHGDFNIPMYDFSIGLGNAVSFSFEPIYWLYALFAASDVELAYNLILILRFFAAGISMSIFLLYFKRSHYEALFGSIMYAFCGFAIYAGVLHGHFISPMILLPLLIIATEELYQKKRWYLCTIFVALALLSSYYFLYMSSLAMGIYFLSRFLFTNNKEKKNLRYFFSSACTFACSYLLGVAIGNFPLFTSFTSYVNSGRKGTTMIATPSFFFYKESWLIKCFLSFISTPDSPGLWLKLSFIPFAYIAVIILFIKKGQKLLKGLFLLLTSFCIFPIAGFVFSGFSSITNRWCYIFALLVTFITVRALPQLRELSKHELKLILLGILPYGLITLASPEYRTPSNLAALALLLMNYLLIFFMNKEVHILKPQNAKAFLLLLCCVSLCLNSFYQYAEETNNTTTENFPDYGTVLSNIKDTPLSALEELPDENFYRVSTPEIPLQILSSSLVMGYNSIAVFSSTIDGPIVDYNSEMGNTAWNLVQLAGFDNRTLLNELACIKYYSVTEEQKAHIPYGYKEIDKKVISGKTYYIYENVYALPFGYTYSNTLTENELQQYSPVQKQEILLCSAVVEDDKSMATLTEKALETDSVEIPITDYIADGVEISDGVVTVTEPEATLTLKFDGITDSETSLEFTGQFVPEEGLKNQVLETELTCDNITKEYIFRSEDHTYYTGQDTYVFNLGYRKDTANSCTITFHDVGTFEYDSLKIYCQPMEKYASYINTLKEDVLENVNISANSITGDISLNEKKLLVLSMPYQKGWTAYVDGKKTEIVKANIMYTGLYLDAGNHKIELKYERPGLKLAVIISLSGIIIFVIALIIRRRRIKIKKANKL